MFIFSDSINGLHVLLLQSLQVGGLLTNVSLSLPVFCFSVADSLFLECSVLCLPGTDGDLVAWSFVLTVK